VLVEYGTTSAPHYVLVDGGTPETFDALRTRLHGIGSPALLDLLVVTHIDEDHIGGVLKLLAHPSPLVRPDDVWFNAYHHLFRPMSWVPGREKPSRQQLSEGASLGTERSMVGAL